MPMTPEEYAAKELNVTGWDTDEPIYAPESDLPPGYDPNILTVLNGGPVQPQPTPEQDPRTVEMAFEYNFTLPLELRRAELAAQINKANFWHALSLAINAIVGMVK
jgi:hypothetical protein